MNNLLFITLCVVFIASCVAQQADISPDGVPANVGDTVFIKSWNDGEKRDWSETDLTVPGTLTKSKFVTGYKGNKALNITAPTLTSSQSYYIQTDFGNPAFIMGTKIRLSATLKSIGVSRSTNPVGGIGVRLVITYYPDESGTRTQVVHRTAVNGTFDWSSTAANIDFVVPNLIQNIQVVIGIFASTGTVLFDSVRITVLESPMPALIFPPNQLWNLSISCYDDMFPRPDQIKTCEAEIPRSAGYIFPNSFQMRIGAGPYQFDGPASICEVAYLNYIHPTEGLQYVNNIRCKVYPPGSPASGTYRIYVRNYIQQSWVLTKSTSNITYY